MDICTFLLMSNWHRCKHKVRCTHTKMDLVFQLSSCFSYEYQQWALTVIFVLFGRTKYNYTLWYTNHNFRQSCYPVPLKKKDGFWRKKNVTLHFTNCYQINKTSQTLETTLNRCQLNLFFYSVFSNPEHDVCIVLQQWVRTLLHGFMTNPQYIPLISVCACYFTA